MCEQKKPYRVVRVENDEWRDKYISSLPNRIVRVGGCEFHLFAYLDEYTKQKTTDLPEFYDHPEYTGEGRPFASIGQEPCSYAQPRDTSEPTLYECYECKFFRQGSPPDIIGICMCEKRRCEPNKS